jgi:hypothetical protein
LRIFSEGWKWLILFKIRLRNLRPIRIFRRLINRKFRLEAKTICYLGCVKADCL